MAEILVVEHEDRVVQLLATSIVVDGVLHEAWIDCPTIDSIDAQRESFPGEVYREIVITDSHIEYDESLDQEEYLTAEDEIDALKQRVVELEAELLARELAG